METPNVASAEPVTMVDKLALNKQLKDTTAGMISRLQQRTKQDTDTDKDTISDTTCIFSGGIKPTCILKDSNILSETLSQTQHETKVTI